MSMPVGPHVTEPGWTTQEGVGGQVLYLGISGVLHPSAWLYCSTHGRSPWSCGHRLYEGVPLLLQALEPYPDVKIVLTSTQPWARGLPSVIQSLGSALGRRVLGFTFEDLTFKVRRGRRQLPMSNEDYWRHNKAEIVRIHREWMRPDAWVAVDDDSLLWTEDEMADHVVLTDGCSGLQSVVVQQRLFDVLADNFSRHGT